MSTTPIAAYRSAAQRRVRKCPQNGVFRMPLSGWVEGVFSGAYNSQCGPGPALQPAAGAASSTLLSGAPLGRVDGGKELTMTDAQACQKLLALDWR